MAICELQFVKSFFSARCAECEREIENSPWNVVKQFKIFHTIVQREATKPIFSPFLELLIYDQQKYNQYTSQSRNLLLKLIEWK